MGVLRALAMITRAKERKSGTKRVDGGGRRRKRAGEERRGERKKEGGRGRGERDRLRYYDPGLRVDIAARLNETAREKTRRRKVQERSGESSSRRLLVRFSLQQLLPPLPSAPTRFGKFQRCADAKSSSTPIH